MPDRERGATVRRPRRRPGPGQRGGGDPRRHRRADARADGAKRASSRRRWSAASSRPPDDLDAEFPAVAARGIGLDSVPLLCTREIDVPGLDAARGQGDGPLLRRRRSPAGPHLPRRRAGAALRPRARHNRAPMSITFAEKLARIPGYQAGVPAGQAPEQIAAGEIAQLASNESPFPPHPEVIEAIERAAPGDEPLPGPRRDPAAPPPGRALRGGARERSRSGTAPARSSWPRRRRSASRAPRSSTPGRPSRSTPTWRRSRERARSASRSRRATSTTSRRC